jgi:hypothetical protein
MDLELAKLLLANGVPVLAVVALIVMKQRESSRAKPDEETGAAARYFQLNALWEDFKEFSDRMDRRHEVVTEKLNDIHNTVKDLHRRRA